jgi:protocatechuate 3,4-dioxygenase beta subunit
MRCWLYRGSERYLLTNWSAGFKRAAGSGTATPNEEEEAPGLDTPPPIESDTSWIKIQILDDESGNPIEGVRLRLNITERGVEEHTTDANGRINIDGLQPGTFNIEAMMDEEAYEVIQVS